jgi:hypothetical protein
VIWQLDECWGAFGLLLLNLLLAFVTGTAFGAGAGAFSTKRADYGINDDFTRSVNPTAMERVVWGRSRYQCFSSDWRRAERVDIGRLLARVLHHKGRAPTVGKDAEPVRIAARQAGLVKQASDEGVECRPSRRIVGAEKRRARHDDIVRRPGKTCIDG